MLLFFQIPDPPTGADTQLYVWIIIVLIATIGGIITIYFKAQADVKAAHKARMQDKDEIIKALNEKLDLADEENRKLIGEFKPAFDSIERVLVDINKALNK